MGMLRCTYGMGPVRLWKDDCSVWLWRRDTPNVTSSSPRPAKYVILVSVPLRSEISLGMLEDVLNLMVFSTDSKGTLLGQTLDCI